MRLPMKTQRLWFLVHGWVSLPVWILFCFVCITGTIASVSHEITWLANPQARASNPEGLPAQPPSAWISAAQNALPEAQVTGVMRLDDYLVSVVLMASKDAPNTLVYVNPYTARVQEINHGLTFIGFMRSLHGWLLFPWQASYSIGYYLVSALSLLLLTSLVTGLVVHKKFWRSFHTPVLRRGQGLRILSGDWHRLAGVWSIWFIVIISATGVWYLAKAVMWHNDIPLESPPAPLVLSSLPVSADGTPLRMISVQQAVDIALQKMPALAPSWIAAPEHNRDYYRILGGNGAMFYDAYSSAVFINPWDGTIVSTQDPSLMGIVQRLPHLADPLHYGTFGGLASKLVWCFSGLVLSSLSISGFIVWYQRIFRRQRKKYQIPYYTGKTRPTGRNANSGETDWPIAGKQP
ncbi:Uncharacterized iron-regulated membrane protein [gamma proteobacterium HdN1]|nr:Uncharacterized iron-regulated membrane protein [gamma proteobacterium HdN1]